MAQAQTDWFVDSSGAPPGSGTIQDPYTSIQYGIDQTTTQSGDRLLVASGTYSESISFQGKDLVVTHDGIGAMPHIEGDGLESAVQFVAGETSNARLVRFVVTGSVSTSSFQGQPGGGILIDGATPVLQEVTVRDCSARAGGGIAVLSGGLTLDECQVLENTAFSSGGGILIEEGHLVIRGGVIRGNSADLNSPGENRGGGIAALEDSTVVMEGTLVELNTLNIGLGNGIYASGPIDLVDVVFRRNFTLFLGNSSGGGIYGPLATGTNCLFESNANLYTNDGAGAWGGTWTDCTFRDNNCCGRGGGLFGGTAQTCLFEGNVLSCEDAVGGSGAGAYESVLLDCFITGNVSFGNGGGAAQSNLQRCIVRDNRCVGSFLGSGGGIIGGTATDCLIEGNKVLPNANPNEQGGGAYLADLLRCVVRGNVAPIGGGVSGGTVDRCTIVHNVSAGSPFTPDVSGVTNAIVTNSILWGNEPVEQRLSTVSYSNVQDSTPGVGNFSADPMFFGPGSDVHLLDGSPCIDAGDPAAPLDPDGSRADVGAIPFEPTHRREDAAFCFGLLGMELEGELSATSSTAVLTSKGAVAFVIGGDAGYSPVVFANPSFPTRVSGLCMTAPFARFIASPSGRLELTSGLLGRLGLAPGDRLYVQAYKNLFGAGVETSRGLDLLVLP